MTVEGWQLATAALGILGGSWGIVQRYFARLEKRLDDIDRRQDEANGVKSLFVSHEVLDRQQFGEIDRRIEDMTLRLTQTDGALNSKADTNATALAGLRDVVIEMRTELRLRNEIRGMVGRRGTDRTVEGGP